MAKVYSERIICAIDIGTTKICVLIAQHIGDKKLEILGVGKVPSDGLNKGVVVDVARTVHSIKSAVKEAELMAAVQVESAYIGISGGHIESINSRGMVPIHKGDVRQSDIDDVLQAARAIPIAQGQQILHVLPQYYVIDGRDRVSDPLGMHGIRLEVEVHIILGAIASVQNLVKCCEQAGVKVNDIILEQLASADAVLSKDEQVLGVGVLDIGGGTSDLALYQHGSIRHTMVLPVAGNHFTNDLAIGLRTTRAEAERVKKEYGVACLDLIKEDQVVELESVQGNAKHSVYQTDINEILQPRAQEVLSIVHEEILKRKLQTFVTTGLVLTGGGSLLPGMKELAEVIFGMPVRIGNPRIEFDLPESLRSPIFATGYGLLLRALDKDYKSSMQRLDGPMVERIFARMKTWVSDFF